MSVKVDSPERRLHNKVMDFEILIVDDELEVCRSLGEILCSRGYKTRYETEPTKVLPNIRSRRIDLVLMDLRMPDVNGIDLLKMIRKSYPDLGVIIISGFATVENAVRAMRYGALNLFTKPLKTSLLIKEIERFRQSMKSKQALPENATLVTEDPRMRHILSLVETAAPTGAPVLITGESGTGKELIANTIHALSGRGQKSLVKINCASIPETLLESEMFGHERGAFTDAKEQKRGLFELASGGTLFLDEIGDMSLNMQAKMLHVLQDGRFVRLGGTEFHSADCRIIAATNHNLDESIKSGGFREDLYYRLAVIKIHLPPLRERKQDILALANHFLEHFCRMYDKNKPSVSPAIKLILLNHTWPGNIRELKNFMERAVIFTSGNSIEIDALPDQYRKIADVPCGQDLYERVDGIARDIIIEALSMTNGVKQDAARLLRIDRKTLYNRMKKFHLT
jgi:DNA-binding NtrC family response regulator